MTVITMDCAAESLRGELTRWFLEVKPGVFVGNINSRIRELLWERLCVTEKAAGAVMIYDSKTEQGFAMRLAGMPKRKIVDIDGIQLVKIEQN